MYQLNSSELSLVGGGSDAPAPNTVPGPIICELPKPRTVFRDPNGNYWYLQPDGTYR